MRLVSVVTSTRSFLLRPLADFFQKVVHLAGDRPHLDLGIHQAGGPDDLLHHLAAAFFKLVVGGSGGDKDQAVDLLLELVELHGTVVQGAGQAEAVFDQAALARVIALVHGADLRDSDVGLIDDQKVILREVVEEAVRTLSGFASAEMARVVFDAAAVAHLEHHFEVIVGAHLQALGLQQAALTAQQSQTLAQLFADRAHGGLELGRWITKCLAGYRARESCRPRTSPVSGSMRLMRSTSSPKSSIRRPVSS